MSRCCNRKRRIIVCSRNIFVLQLKDEGVSFVIFIALLSFLFLLPNITCLTVVSNTLAITISNRSSRSLSLLVIFFAAFGPNRDRVSNNITFHVVGCGRSLNFFFFFGKTFHN
ncbi:PREDICTED: uncharacterized protein LOC101295584 [Fragaria vesca subsp. vesca]